MNQRISHDDIMADHLREDGSCKWKFFIDEFWKPEERDWYRRDDSLRRTLAVLTRYAEFFLDQRDETIDWEDGGPGTIAAAERVIKRAKRLLGITEVEALTDGKV